MGSSSRFHVSEAMSKEKRLAPALATTYRVLLSPDRPRDTRLATAGAAKAPVRVHAPATSW